MLAPVSAPPNPKGKKGCQFVVWTWETPTTMKKRITASLMATMRLLTQLVSRVPLINSALMAMMLNIAGRLIAPPEKGDEVSATGSVTPKLLLRKSTTYPDQPMATAAAPTEYSRIRSHPMIQA